MSAQVLLNLLNEFGKRGKRRGLPSILFLFRNEFNKFNNTRARMYGSPEGTFLLITYHLLLTTYYLSLITYNLLLITYHLLLTTYHITGPRSAVSNVSGNRCESDCRSRGRKFDLG